ncbi:blue light sensor protein [Chromobacterium sp. LK1]|uniref:BLUF domain-containing protein n=1 Tax=Chromobacterium sp. LK1 TaxID=1628193 RepID=UPI000653092E|nr:BLUF domain-containing protein [Chromobacterium sp. LK1]KMN36141.1 blue light sensor protein [Chromobacterium sp. LK1]
MLVRLTYCSRAHKSIDNDLVDDIMIAARKYNPAQGITGVLCYSKDVFVQSLEGGRAEVNLLYQKLAHDPRHHALTLLDYQEISQRRFANWSMAEVMMDKLNTSLLLRYSAQPRLDPFEQPGASTALLLEALAEAGSTQIRH